MLLFVVVVASRIVGRLLSSNVNIIKIEIVLLEIQITHMNQLIILDHQSIGSIYYIGLLFRKRVHYTQYTRREFMS